MSFTRASSGRTKDATLKLITAAAGVLRSGHYLNRFVKGTLLEPAGQNDWTVSEQLDDAAYTKSGATVSVDVATAPDGQSTADKLVESALNEAHQVQRNAPGTPTADTHQAVSFFAAPAGRTEIRVELVTKAGTVLSATVALATGATLTQDTGVEMLVEPYFSSFYRVLLRYDVGTGGSTPLLRILLRNDAGLTTYLGDGSSGAYLWGFQWEIDKPFPTSYIPTAGAAASRAVDSLTLAFAFPAQTMTIYANAVEIGAKFTGSTSKTRLADVGDDAQPSRFELRHGANFEAVHIDDGSKTVSSAKGHAAVLGATVEALAQINHTGSVRVLRALDGSVLQAGPTSAVQTISANFGLPGPLRIGSFDGAAAAPVLIRNVQPLRGVTEDLELFRSGRLLVNRPGFGEGAFGVA